MFGIEAALIAAVIGLAPDAAPGVSDVTDLLSKVPAQEGGFCSLMPEGWEATAGRIWTGSETGELPLAAVAGLLNGLPQVEDPNWGTSTVSIDVTTFLRIVSAACLVEPHWLAGEQKEVLDPLFERVTFHALFWKRNLSNDLLVQSIFASERPDLAKDAPAIAEAAEAVKRIEEAAQGAYAKAALRLAAGKLPGDTMLLRRIAKFFDLRSDVKATRLMSRVVFEATGDGTDCAVAVNRALRALDVKSASALKPKCIKLLASDVAADWDKNFETMLKAARLATELSDRSDADGRIRYAHALLDLGRTEEGEAMLSKLSESGEQDSRICTPLALAAMRRGEYATGVDTLSALADEHWDRSTANALAAASCLVVLKEILVAAGFNGAAGAKDVIDTRGEWLRLVMARVERYDPALADYMEIIVDAVRVMVTESAETRWRRTGELSRDRLLAHKSKHGTDPNWGRLAVISALFANQDRKTVSFLADGLAALEKDDDLVPSALAVSVMVDLFSSGDVSKATASKVLGFKRSQEPLGLLAAAQYVASRKRKDKVGMDAAANSLAKAAEQIKAGSNKVAAMNNLAVLLAENGRAEEAVEVLGAAANVALNDDDRLLVQVNRLAIAREAGELPPGGVDFLMSVASSDQPSDVVKMVSARLLLRSRKQVPGLKLGAIAQVLSESEARLRERGFYAPEMRAAVMAQVNFTPQAEEKFGGKVVATFGVTADVTLFLWFEPEA